jgi:two-component system phosphate regulon sensor histidine kinase PhoR
MVERRAADLDKDRIELSFAADLPSLSADPDRLERILVHLLSNALKYSDAPAKVLLRAGCADGFVTLAVTDHGVGISRRDLPQLFERSSEPRPGSRQESLGIGLTITELLVRAHGGRIEVESELGKGSVFRVYLPVDGSASCPTPAA